MPWVDAGLDLIGEAHFLPTIDLIKGYWQILLSGLCHFTKMPLGLHGATASFHRVMDRVLGAVCDCVTAYIDNLLVFSPLWKHLVHLHRVFSPLWEAGLTANETKSWLERRLVQYLGFCVGSGTVQAIPDKVDTLCKVPWPQYNKQDVQRFLGLASYYRWFVPYFTSLAASLSDLTQGEGLSNLDNRG